MTSNRIVLFTLALLLILPEARAFECKKKVDPKRVIIMLDTNGGAEEVAAAERSACARGETLRVLPEISKTLGPLTTEGVVLHRKATKACKDDLSTTPQCERAKAELSKKRDEIRSLTAGIRKSLRDPLEQELERLQKTGAKLTSMVMSGHDGGGTIWGVAGETSQLDFYRLQKKFSGVFGDVESLYLLGCYTAVPVELKEWKEVFPKLKLLAGYEGSAPLIDMKAGHYYLEDMLKREQSMVRAANEKKLEAEFKNKVRGIANVNAAVFVNLGPPCKQCENAEPQNYYYRSQRKLGPKLIRMSERECEAARQERPPFREDLEKLMSGEMPVPTDTARGRMREIYEFFRRNEHCFMGESDYFKADRLLFLLFFDDVRKNFATYYAKDLKEARAVLERMTEPAELSRRLDAMVEEKKNELDWWKPLMDRNSTDAEGVRRSLREEMERLETEIAKRQENYNKYQQLDYEERAKLGDAAWKSYRETRLLMSRRFRIDYALVVGINSAFQMVESDWTGAVAQAESKKASIAKTREKIARLDKMSGASRLEIRELLSTLDETLSDSTIRPREQAVIEKIKYPMSEKLYLLSCLPFSWHEASERPEKPVCHDTD